MAIRDCDNCVYFVYDEEYDSYLCEINLDEDEMERFLRGGADECAYFRLDDEYGVVRKQN